ncbi:MAG TPA: AAA family ATPase, partial [Ilumatobacter sp.]
MRRTLAILNQKGGVGKTTVTLGLASAAAAAGRRTLVVDLDPQGSSTWVLGVDVETLDATVADVLHTKGADARAAIRPSAWSDAIDVLPSSSDLQDHEDGKSKRLRKAIAAVEQNYDAVLIDCPPSLGLLTINALAAADSVLVPLQCEFYALEGLTHL